MHQSSIGNWCETTYRANLDKALALLLADSRPKMTNIWDDDSSIASTASLRASLSWAPSLDLEHRYLWISRTVWFEAFFLSAYPWISSTVCSEAFFLLAVWTTGCRKCPLKKQKKASFFCIHMSLCEPFDVETSKENKTNNTISSAEVFFKTENNDIKKIHQVKSPK